MAAGEPTHINRRMLLIGGGAGVGLLVAWAVWPRSYAPNLTASKGEHIYGAWLKIGEDGHVAVAVPQAEHGQGVYTTLPQIVADELGADWRTVAVEPAPLNPLYANPLGEETIFAGAFARLPQGLREEHVKRSALVLTGGSTSIRQFEEPLREAGAAARVMLCRAAARRWKTDWRACGTANGFVIHGDQKLRFGELAAEAVKEDLPDPLPFRGGDANRLYGQSLPRLDVPAKVDGSANFAGDVRLPGMAFAAIRQGPAGEAKLVHADTEAAGKVHGVLQVVTNDQWVAAVADNWWAANRALDALAPRFETNAKVASDSIASALQTALNGPGERMAAAGDLSAAFKGASVVTAEYQVGLGVHAAIEPMSATAHFHDGRLELWLPTLAPGLARSAAAATLGISESHIVVHPMLLGGSFGAGLEHQAAEQAALLSQRTGRPVQLTWSRSEDLLHDRYRPAAVARMSARIGPNGQILGWLAKIAAPTTGRELAGRLLVNDKAARAALAVPRVGDPFVVEGAEPFYHLPAYAVDHHPADIGVPTGYLRGAAHGYTCFFTECFLDELAHVAQAEPLSFRIGMLGGDARLARCLSTVAQLGGWQGGVEGSGQGIACHAFRGSFIAVLAEAHIEDDQSVSVDRLVAAVDCGRQVNPDVVRQQIEGGLVFGMAMALGASTGFTKNLADARSFDDLNLPRLADTPDITVELIASEADPGGVGEIAVPPVAPAIANALRAASGTRLRALPLDPSGA